jgi:hypothetical protein
MANMRVKVLTNVLVVDGWEIIGIMLESKVIVIVLGLVTEKGSLPNQMQLKLPLVYRR